MVHGSVIQPAQPWQEMHPLRRSRLSGHRGAGAAFKWTIVIPNVVLLPLAQLGEGRRAVLSEDQREALWETPSARPQPGSPCFMLLHGAQSLRPDLGEVCVAEGNW